MMRAWLLMAGLLLAGPLHAEDAGSTLMPSVGATAIYSDDSEGFRTSRLGVAGFTRYEHADQLSGVQFTHHQFQQDDWRREAEQLSLIHRDYSPRAGTGLLVDAGLNTQGGRTLLVTDSSWSRRLRPSTGIEAFINRDWVETRTALDAGTSHTFVGADIEQQIHPKFSLLGMLGRQQFSDGNGRNHLRLRAVYQPMMDSGLTLQARYRSFRSEEDRAGLGYFNPLDYQERMFAIGWRKKFEPGWTLKGTLGTGRQTVDDDPDSPTRIAELSVTSPYQNRLFFRLNLGYNRSASFQGPDYSYRYVKAEWVFALR
jgi:hypothetical protein